MVNSNNEYGANLAKETLTGDVASFLVDRLRQFPKSWQQMSEKEQSEQIERAKDAAKNLVAEAVKIVSSGGRRTVQAELGKITVDKGIKAEIKVNAIYADELIAVQGKAILIVTNSDDEFTGGESKLKADPDQKEMFENCNTEYQEDDGEEIPNPEEKEQLALPSPDDQNITDAEFEEVDLDEAQTTLKNEEISDVEIDSVDAEFDAEEQDFTDEEVA